jgi:hypothetical protein
MYINSQTVKKQVAEMPYLEKQLFEKRKVLEAEFESAENTKNVDIMEKVSHKGQALEMEMMHFIAYKVGVMAYYISQNPDFKLN